MNTYVKFNSITKSTGGQTSANGQFTNAAGTAFGGNFSINSGGGASYVAPGPGGAPAVAPLVVDLSSLDVDVVYAFTLAPALTQVA